MLTTMHRTLFTKDKTWKLYHDAKPFYIWGMNKIKDYRNNAAKNDIYRKTLFYVQDVIKKSHSCLRSLNISFILFHCNL